MIVCRYAFGIYIPVKICVRQKSEWQVEPCKDLSVVGPVRSDHRIGEVERLLRKILIVFGKEEPWNQNFGELC